MIQLPSKIRRVYFNLLLSDEPLLILAYEPNRIAAIIDAGYSTGGLPAFGSSGQSALESDFPASLFTTPHCIYGPEELYGVSSKISNTGIKPLIIVQAIYYA